MDAGASHPSGFFRKLNKITEKRMKNWHIIIEKTFDIGFL